MPASHHGGSPSIHQSDYWWYTARADLLRTVLSPYVADGARVLDVGSADGPSVGWLEGRGRHTAVDIDIRGLGPGDVCGSATALPFHDGAFDVVAAFDVIEHVDPEHLVVAELRAGAGDRWAPAGVRARLQLGLERPRHGQRPPPPLHASAPGRRAGARAASR